MNINEIKFIKVDSSNLDAIGYSRTTLLIRFKNGEIYKYYYVPRKVFVDLITSKSHGQYFNSFIKYKFKYKKV